MSDCYRFAPWGGLNISAQGSAANLEGLEAQPQAAFACRNIPIENGGAERDRTVDPLLAKQVLSQLSYSPLPSE